MKLDPYLTPIIKKLIPDVSRHKCKLKLQVLEENIGVNLCDLGLSNGFLDIAPEAQAK